jgi:hypothetical protein
MTLKVVDPETDYVSPDAEGRGHDYSRDEPDDSASEGGRELDFGGGNRSSGRVGEQAMTSPAIPLATPAKRAATVIQ